MTEEKPLSGYELSREWFDFCFENPDKINPNHSALFFFCIEHCNRLGWKSKFGLPTTMAMEAIGIKSYNTYIKTLNELIDLGFINLIQKSKNQYSSNIVALSKNNKALNKALDKALTKHLIKHSESTGESKVSIDKQYNQEQYNQEQSEIFSFCDSDFLLPLKTWLKYRSEIKKPFKAQKSIEGQYDKLKKLSGGNCEIATKIVEQSMTEGWQGLFKLKDEMKAQNNAKPQNKPIEPKNYDEEF